MLLHLAPSKFERRTLNSAKTDKRSNSPTKSAKRRSLLVPILIAVVAVGLIVFSLTGGDDENSAPTATPTPTSTDNTSEPEEDFQPTQPEPSDEEIDEMVAELSTFSHREADDPLAMGDVDAPLVMIVYSDFQCPFCGEWARTTMPVLVEKYVDSGDLRIEWRDMAVLGNGSQDAALAGRAAANQGKFWEFSDVLYDEEWQAAATDDSYGAEAMADIAVDLGMDREQFLADIADADTEAAVEADRDEAWSIGFTGTPAFLVEGLPVMGAQPLETFESAIEKRLGEVQEN